MLKAISVKNINIHIYPSTMTNESRIFKEAAFIAHHLDFESVLLMGLWKKGLAKEECLEAKIHIKRIVLFGIQKRAVLYTYLFVYSLLFIVVHRPKMINIHTVEFLPLAFVAKCFGLKVIYDTHELETQKANAKGLRQKLSMVIESVFIRYADVVIVVGEMIADVYKKMYPKRQRPYVVLNTPPYCEVVKRNIFRELFGISQEHIIFLYQGGLGKGRGVEMILEAFQGLQDTPYVVVFMGSGLLETSIIEASKRYKNIFFHHAVEPKVLLDYTSSADFGLLLYENTCLNHAYCCPNKLFEYMMAELPVMVSPLPEISALVTRHQIGMVLEEESVEGLKKAIDTIASWDKQVLIHPLKRVKMAYNWEAQEEILRKIYQEENP